MGIYILRVESKQFRSESFLVVQTKSLSQPASCRDAQSLFRNTHSNVFNDDGAMNEIGTRSQVPIGDE